MTVPPIVVDAARSVLEAFGPFVIPGVVFICGVVGYLFLYAIGRYRGDDYSSR
jgi:membrane protein DedA with SNARE-associated domain